MDNIDDQLDQPPAATTFIVWDVFARDKETDLDELYKKIIEEFKMEGITWTGWEKILVGDGVFKMQIGAYVVDS